MRPFICEVTDLTGKTWHLDALADSAQDVVKIVEEGLEPGAEVTDVFDEAVEDSDPRIPLPADIEIGKVKMWNGEKTLKADGLIANKVALKHGGKVR